MQTHVTETPAATGRQGMGGAPNSVWSVQRAAGRHRKGRGFEERTMSRPHREADGGQGTSLSSATQEPRGHLGSTLLPYHLSL